MLSYPLGSPVVDGGGKKDVLPDRCDPGAGAPGTEDPSVDHENQPPGEPKQHQPFPAPAFPFLAEYRYSKYTAFPASPPGLPTSNRYGKWRHPLSMIASACLVSWPLCLMLLPLFVVLSRTRKPRRMHPCASAPDLSLIVAPLRARVLAFMHSFQFSCTHTRACSAPLPSHPPKSSDVVVIDDSEDEGMHIAEPVKKKRVLPPALTRAVSVPPPGGPLSVLELLFRAFLHILQGSCVPVPAVRLSLNVVVCMLL